MNNNTIEIASAIIRLNQDGSSVWQTIHALRNV